MTTVDHKVEQAADKLRPQLGSRPKPSKESGSATPWLVVGLALAAGILLAKWVDRRGNAHP